MFSNCCIGSPDLNAHTGTKNLLDLEEEYYTRSQTLNANVYITIGGYEETGFVQDIENFGEYEQSRNYEGMSFKYELIPKATHEMVFKPSIRNALLMYYQFGF